ncbi:hypothetical protein C1X05_10445 [Laceyella sacchari]|nr:hypothetical protein C1X05_10445 [Laceyella sacchari]
MPPSCNLYIQVDFILDLYIQECQYEMKRMTARWVGLSGMMVPVNGYKKVKGTGGGLGADLFLLYIGESPLRRLSSGRREEVHQHQTPAQG